eukprot:2758421-Alexandrium_andersonii.AAC.1
MARSAEALTNEEFAHATMWRLFIPFVPTGVCKERQLQSEGRKCGKLLDANLEHPRLCQLGAAKSRIHTA